MGAVYALHARVLDEPSIVLAGVELRRELTSQIEVRSFVKELIGQIKLIGAANSIHHLYTAIGDGRDANLSEVRDGLHAIVKERIQLSENEVIMFPTGAGYPITVLGRL